ncbi:hypothetical protein LEMLEM_LOCUS401 [Lemmus lemmus]
MAAAPAAAGAGASRGRQSAATAVAWGGWGGRPRPGNILLQLRQGQLTGRGLIRAVQVRGRPGGAGRGGPDWSWPGAGKEAFPGRCSTGQIPLGWPRGCPVCRPDAVSRGGTMGSGRLGSLRVWAEWGRAAWGIDGAYEPWADFLDPHFPAPRLHVGGTLASWLHFLLASRLLLVSRTGSFSLQPPERFASLSYLSSSQ